MFIYTIYRYPKDYPNLFVVRRWNLGTGQTIPIPEMEPWFLGDTLKQARQSIPRGMVQMLEVNGDAAIIETWL